MSDHLKIPCVKIAQILVAPSSTSFWAACKQCLSIEKGKISVHVFFQYLLSVVQVMVLTLPSQLTPRPRPQKQRLLLRAILLYVSDVVNKDGKTKTISDKTEEPEQQCRMCPPCRRPRWPPSPGRPQPAPCLPPGIKHVLMIYFRYMSM